MEFAARRDRLVERLRERGVIERNVTAEAIRAVPRHEFVPAPQRDDAYRDKPLPIGSGQTVSAPHMVAMMIEHLGLERGDRVLEVGTGCGYHAAVTAEVVGPGNVYSVEYVPELAERARETFDRLGDDIAVRTGDGHEGWPEHAPYDAAYLTCAAREVPPAVVKQVRAGGRVLAPVGDGSQQLVLMTVHEGGRTDRETLEGVRFVRMQGE
ncbi:protein-L-isoaspartate O-methyltransferase [Halolamina litorea]|uniref:Protein-L-isoaspartate O-methyltransferase n=1 Tax=Halolamina litorea TaxID=1515593 RepID=A0ABD6BNW2_9EURY|nr:protein-L-isoaspartate(D-aspartate) O-methyltransferase [Halolamina litorea]